MAAAVAARALPVTFGRLASACSRSVLRASGPGAASLWSASQRFSSQSASSPQGYVPKTSLSSPPWPEVVLPDPVEEARHHAEVVEKVNELIARGQYGRLFAVVHFASHQWKVTSEDLILIENKLDVACGERIRLEKKGSCSSGSHGHRKDGIVAKSQHEVSEKEKLQEEENHREPADCPPDKHHRDCSRPVLIVQLIFIEM
uniref:Mitochondrial ribosomal protein L21 n=1 Tax=Ovis aries TaxID=9940 RepID=A0AC11BXV3_SHEEP